MIQNISTIRILKLGEMNNPVSQEDFFLRFTHLKESVYTRVGGGGERQMEKEPLKPTWDSFSQS